jgi:hypothetical protein
LNLKQSLSFRNRQCLEESVHPALDRVDPAGMAQPHLRDRRSSAAAAWTRVPCLPHGRRTHQPFDGNRVELQIDNFESEAELERWMKSDAFAANPIGAG